MCSILPVGDPNKNRCMSHFGSRHQAGQKFEASWFMSGNIWLNIWCQFMIRDTIQCYIQNLGDVQQYWDVMPVNHPHLNWARENPSTVDRFPSVPIDFKALFHWSVCFSHTLTAICLDSIHRHTQIHMHKHTVRVAWGWYQRVCIPLWRWHTFLIRPFPWNAVSLMFVKEIKVM